MKYRKNSLLAMLLILLTTNTVHSYSQTNGWTQKANIGGMGHISGVGYSIGSKGYIGTGVGQSYRKDFWEYDPTTNIWTQKADFGGGYRWGAVGFSIGSKGYTGTGGDYNGIGYADFWEYDPLTNTWTQKADCGGGLRTSAVGFSIGSKGYLGTGYYNGNFKKDFWEYDPITNVWTQKADFGGGNRYLAVGFSIGSKGYLGTGNYPGDQSDFWEYDPLTNLWTQKADFGGGLRNSAVGFSIGSKGYLGTGMHYNQLPDFWEYDPLTNQWKQKSNFGGGYRYAAVGFSIGDKGYLGTGKSFDNNIYFNDFWEFDPCALYITTQPINQNRCLGSGVIFNVVVNGCNVTYEWKHDGNIHQGSNSSSLVLNNLTSDDAGNYTCTINMGISSVTTNPALLTLNPAPTGTFSLSAPANGTWVNTTSTFSWQTASGATFYQLYIDGTLKKDNIIGNSCTLQSTEALNPGIHTWYIKANSCTQSSETWSIRVDATPPTTFNLLTPSDNTWTASLQPAFQWSASLDAGSGLAKYQLWIDGTLNRDNIPGTSTSTTPATSLSEGTHTWMIKAVDNVGNVRNSNQTFDIKIDNTPPGTFNHSALNFDGTYGYVNIGSNALYNMTYNYTIETWVCLLTGGNNNPRIISKQTDVNGMGGDYSIYTNGTGSFRTISFWINNIGTITSTQSVVAGVYHHIAVTINGNSSYCEMRIYINGVQSAFNSFSGVHTPSTTSLVFGRKGSGSNKLDMYKGFLDEVRFWNYCRSQSQITQFKDVPLIGNEPGLIGYWKFDEESGSTAYNQTNNGNGIIYQYASYSTTNLPPLNLLSNLYSPQNIFLPGGPILFQWSSAPDLGIGFKKFQLFVDNNQIADNLNDTAYYFSAPLSYGQHYWFIKGFDSLDNNQSSATKIFNIDNVKPNPFNLIIPSDSAIVDLPTPNLQWQGSADSVGGSGLRKYQLFLNNGINRDSIPIAQTSVSPVNALSQGAYRWHIKAIDNVGNARLSTNNVVLSKNYNFSASSGTYNEISGTQLIGSNAYGVVSSVMDIGFNFTYIENNYTNFSVNSNGVIFLGVLGNTSNINSLTNGTPRPIIAPLWDDLKTGSSGSVSYFLTGTSGTRVLTIQFKQMKWYYSVTQPVISFQVKLYETSNRIEFIYKQEGGTPYSASASIGIAAIGTGSGNFLSLNSTGTNPGVSSQIETTNLSTCPATGQVYRFDYTNYSPASPNSRIFFVDYEPPYDFSLIEPVDNSTIMNCRPIFRWHASGDAGTGLRKYELIISGQPIITLPPSDTLKILDYDLPNGNYNWFVKAYDGANAFTSSDVFNLTLNVPPPLQAATPMGAASVCQGAANVSYSTTGAPYASTYQWSLAPSGCGSITGSSTTATVNFEASFTGTAQILVKGHNSQGYGPLSPALNVTVHQQPIVASKPTGAIVVCQNAMGTVYSTTGSVNATSYGWAVSPSNAGNIIGNAASATVNWNIAYAGVAKVKVRAINPCGQSAWSDSLDVTVNPLPGKPGKPIGEIILCQNPINTNYSTTGAPNTLLYNWHILPDSAGTITWNVIGTTATVDWNASFYGFARIFIIGNNECGDGPVSDTLVVHVYSPIVGAGTITGTHEVCLSQQGVIYTVTPITHADSYIWTMPPGVTGSSTTNNISVNYSPSATSGHITVKGQNFCGTGPISSYYVNMNQLPSIPENISGTGTVQQGQAAVPYTVPFILNATSYEWSLPQGAGITSGSNSNNIGVSFSPTASSGIMKVRGLNLCGYGPFSADFPITVNMASQLQLSGITLSDGDTNCYNALQTLTVAGGGTAFIIQNCGYATMIAGQKIHLLFGTTVQSGGYLWAYITTNNNFCGMQPDSFLNASEVISGTPEIEAATQLFKVYPNPTTGLFTVEFVSAKDLQNGQIKISNILGKQLYHITIPTVGKTEISLNDHPKGVYFITVLLGGKSSTSKIVKH